MQRLSAITKLFAAPFLAGVAAFVLVFATYTIGWWPKDDGVFAHMAERVLSGAVYGVDIQDFHGGYQTFLNAFLFKVFGADMVVLRYPFLLLCAAQSFLVAYMLRSKGFWFSFIGGLSMTTLSFLLFPNASPNWYALFFTILSIFILTEWGWRPYPLIATGLVWGMCLMFRHPSAIFLLMGIVAYGVHQQQVAVPPSFKSRLNVHHAVLVALAAGVLIYSSMVFELFAFLLFGLPALAFTVLLFSRRYQGFLQLLIDALYFGVGAMTAVSPMVIYQIKYGNLFAWFKTSFFGGLNIADLEFFGNFLFIHWFEKNLLPEASLSLVIILIWYFVFRNLVAFAMLGYVLRYWYHKPSQLLPAAVPIAFFYSLVSFYFQIEFYFFVGFPILVLALLMLYENKDKLVTLIFLMCLVNLQIVAVYWSSPSVYRAKFPEKYVTSELSNVSLEVPIGEHDRYLSAVTITEKYSAPGDSMYVFPFNPEYYFLTKRNNPLTVLGSSFESVDREGYERLREQLFDVKPKLIIFATQNMYASEYDWRLYEDLKANPQYELVADEYGAFYFALVD